MKKEQIAAGNVKWAEYRQFFGFAFGGLCGIALIVFVHLIINLCNLAVSLFLAFSLTEMLHHGESVSEAEKRDQTFRYNVVLSSIIVFALLSSFVGKFLSIKLFMGINRRLHDRVTQRVLNTNIVFFEENTQGMILNRFSADVAVMDNMVFTMLEMTDVSSFFVEFTLAYSR